MMIAFPPCTDLCASGARWWKEKAERQASALDFVRALMKAPIKRKAIENPVGLISTRIRKPDQIIQPWQFGHPEVKTTCLWLEELPLLVPTHSERPDLFTALAPAGREQRIWRMPPSPTRGKDRSRTFPRIANAMAAQWGSISTRKAA